VRHFARPESKIFAARQPAGGLRTQRIALSAIFTAHGFMYASWAVRVPAVKQQTGASAAALGLALLGLSAGAVATMLIAGALCRRLGGRRVTVPACAVLSGTLLLPLLAHSALTLGLGLLVFGAAYGCLNVAMNTVAVDLVAALRRPVMPSFHAAWSFGGLAGAGLGGLIAPHLSPLPHLSLVAATGLIVTAVTARPLLHPPAAAVPGSGAAADSRAPASSSGVAGRPALIRVVGVLGLIGLCAAYDEGAIGDWGALHLHQDLGAGAGLAAAGYAAFALAEAFGRLTGSTLLERHGRTRVLVTGGLTACGGMLLAALAPDVWLALAGFAATGAGLANLFPVAVARAGLLAGSSGVALASTLGYGGFLLGPPAIGFLASEFGLRTGLTTLSFLALAAAVIAYAARNS
jgi:MFS family permease